MGKNFFSNTNPKTVLCGTDGLVEAFAGYSHPTDLSIVGARKAFGALQDCRAFLFLPGRRFALPWTFLPRSFGASNQEPTQPTVFPEDTQTRGNSH